MEIKHEVQKRLNRLTSFQAVLVGQSLGACCVLAAGRNSKRAGPQRSKEPVTTGSTYQRLLARYLLEHQLKSILLILGIGRMQLISLAITPCLLAGLGSRGDQW